MRLPIAFGASGAVLKALMLVIWRATQSVSVFRLLTVYDPASFWLAETGVGLLFGDRRIAPSGAEALTFELLLVLGFSLQCFVLGVIVQWLLRTLKHDRRTSTSVEGPRA